jgi:hypothetical protein
MGTTEPLEPDPGRALDGTVVAAGLLLVPAVVVAGAVLASWHAARRVTVERPSVVAGLAARFGLPVPVSIGARFALERGRGAQAVPVLPALTGAVVGVIGVVAALTFADGVTDATTHPERFGQVADLQAFVGFNDQELVPAADLLPLLAEQPDVLAVNDSRQGVAESRSVAMAVYSLDPFDEPLPIVVTEGSFPGPGEVLLAPGTADAIGVEPGDAIEIEGTTSTATLTVSGLAFVPEGSHNDYNGGAWAPSSVYAEVIGEGFKFRTIDIALRPGVDPDEAAARIGAAVGEAVGDPAAAEELLAPVLPASRLGELKEIRRLPVMLAAFLALLAVAAVGHALATAVRRRRQDLAVLRALGVTRWQSRITVITQATLLAAFGVVAGAPLGFILGRTVWHWVADTTPLHHVPPVAAVALALVAPVALVVANLLAAWPSHRAASMRVAHVLRTE